MKTDKYMLALGDAKCRIQIDTAPYDLSHDSEYLHDFVRVNIAAAVTKMLEKINKGDCQ